MPMGSKRQFLKMKMNQAENDKTLMSLSNNFEPHNVPSMNANQSSQAHLRDICMVEEARPSPQSQRLAWHTVNKHTHKCEKQLNSTCRLSHVN